MLSFPFELSLIAAVAERKLLRSTELIEATGAKLIFLPPYSPDLSPIEPCWSLIKLHLWSPKQRALDAPRAAIPRMFLRVRTDQLVGWCKHCGYAQRERSPV